MDGCPKPYCCSQLTVTTSRQKKRGHVIDAGPTG